MHLRPTNLWHNSDFLKLWIGQTISEIGSRVTLVALPLVAVLVLNANPFQMGLLAGIGGLASLVFGLGAGLQVDRLRRRPILIVTDLGRAVVLGSIPVAASFGILSMRQVYVVVATGGILTVLFDVAYQSYLPSLVEGDHVLEGNSKLALSSSFAEIAGPGFTGILVQLLTAPMAILVDALSFLASALSVWLVGKPEADVISIPGSHIWEDFTTGLRAVTHSPIRRAIAGHSATAGFFGGILRVSVCFVRDPIFAPQPGTPGCGDSSRWSRKYFGGGDGPTPHAAIWSGSDPYWVDLGNGNCDPDDSPGAWFRRGCDRFSDGCAGG